MINDKLRRTSLTHIGVAGSVISAMGILAYTTNKNLKLDSHTTPKTSNTSVLEKSKKDEIIKAITRDLTSLDD